jgi:KipI family sensor histidine kinase inhibitor
MIELGPLGDRAFLVRFDCPVRAANWAVAVRAARLAGVIDVVPAFATVAVFGDAEAVAMDELESHLVAISASDVSSAVGRELNIPVHYNGDDLPELSSRLSLPRESIIEAHAEATYSVQAMGFLPGYPYAGPLPAQLRGLPRRESPRVRVPAGSVAIVANQTGIYPEESPGGWHLIGRTPLRIVDAANAHFPIRVGDRLRFFAIDADEFRAREGELL